MKMTDTRQEQAVTVIKPQYDVMDIDDAYYPDQDGVSEQCENCKRILSI
jgi:hypothetical protein